MNNDLISREQVLHEIGSLPLSWEYGQGVMDCYNIVKNAPAMDFSKEICSSCGRYIREKRR